MFWSFVPQRPDCIFSVDFFFSRLFHVIRRFIWFRSRVARSNSTLETKSPTHHRLGFCTFLFTIPFVRYFVSPPKKRQCSLYLGQVPRRQYRGECKINNAPCLTRNRVWRCSHKEIANVAKIMSINYTETCYYHLMEKWVVKLWKKR